MGKMWHPRWEEEGRRKRMKREDEEGEVEKRRRGPRSGNHRFYEGGRGYGKKQHIFTASRGCVQSAVKSP